MPCPDDERTSQVRQVTSPEVDSRSFDFLNDNPADCNGIVPSDPSFSEETLVSVTYRES